VVDLKRVADLMWRRLKLCWQPGVVARVSVLAGCSRLWRLALFVRRGTASEDSTRSNDIVGRLGLQRITAGCSALLGDSSAVHHRKMAQVTT
jgi:hypothetical protein